MSEEEQWLHCLSTEQLVLACKEAGVKVDGFRQIAMVPRLLLERHLMSVLTKNPWHSRAMKLRGALKQRWEERYPILAGVLQAGLPGTAGEEPDAGRWGQWLAGLSRQFGRAPVLAGLNLTEALVQAATADPAFLERLEPFWQQPEAQGAVVPELIAAEAELEPTQEQTADPREEEWRRERAALRAKIKALTQENQALQRARTAAEQRAVHYQSQVERVREEMERLGERSDWPSPTLMVQRLIRGLMEARRQVLDLELEKARLLAEKDEGGGAS